MPAPHTAEQRIVEVLAEADKPLSQAQIRKRAAARNATVSATLQQLIRDGRVERASKACYRLIATAVHDAPKPQGVVDANGQHEAFPEVVPGLTLRSGREREPERVARIARPCATHPRRKWVR